MLLTHVRTAKLDPTTQDSIEEVLEQDYQTAGSASSQEKRVMMKERTVGKETYSVGETVRLQCLQNIKTKKWDILGVVTGIRTADDNTILSYDIDIDGTITSRHQKYMCKTRNSDEATEEENRGGANTATGSSTQ